jgi:hypothetical protein
MTRKPIGSPPPAGRFKVTMHLYVPKSDALTGKWDPAGKSYALEQRS